MRYAMERKDYEELFLMGSQEANGAEGLRGRRSEYPKSTAQAVQELRTRGLDASASVLDYLIEKGAIPAPGGGEGHRRKWSREDIDRVAECMDAKGQYVPRTLARTVLNIDPTQDVRALRQALSEHPEIPGPQLLVLEVLPGAPNVGVRAMVRYRPMTERERAEWKQRLVAARSVKPGDMNGHGAAVENGASGPDGDGKSVPAEQHALGASSAVGKTSTPPNLAATS